MLKDTDKVNMTGQIKQKVAQAQNGFQDMNGTRTNGMNMEETNGIQETNGYMANGHMEHCNGYTEHKQQQQYHHQEQQQRQHTGLTNGHNGITNCNGAHLNHKSVNGFGHVSVVDTDAYCVSLKQTDHVTTESNKTCEQNGEPMYDLCDRLSSVGMDDLNDTLMHHQTSQPAFQDKITVPFEQMPFKWTQDNLFVQDKDGDSCLHIAIILQQMDLAFALINAAVSPRSLSTLNRLSQSPLYLAVLTNQINVVRRLMVGGADVVSRDRRGATPLHVACEKGYTNIVEKLLEPVRYLETKMNTNYEIPYQKIPQDLEITNYDGKTALMVAYESGHYDIVKLLIDKRANINARDGKTGRTILHCACLDGRVELVRFLLSLKDCNINAKSYDDYTPFDFARIRGHTEIAILLAQAGACNREDDDISD